jgi:hypothetical protein
MPAPFTDLTKTPYGGFYLDPCSEVVAYVRATQLPNMPSDVAAKWVADIPSGLARCRAGRNDVVVVLQGHTEDVTSTTLASMVAGTRLIGIGRGSNRPNLRWTATTSQFVMNDADCVIANFILRMEGAVVVKAVAVTAADCAIIGCDIDVATTAATNLSTIGIEIGAGAHRFELRDNYIHGIAAGGSTKVVSVAGVADGVSIKGNRIQAATAAVAIGVIDISAAATGLEIGDNILQNRLASSEAGGSVTGAAACTGVVYRCYQATEAGNPETVGWTLNAASLLRFFDCLTTDTKNTSGRTSPALAAAS